MIEWRLKTLRINLTSSKKKYKQRKRTIKETQDNPEEEETEEYNDKDIEDKVYIYISILNIFLVQVFHPQNGILLKISKDGSETEKYLDISSGKKGVGKTFRFIRIFTKNFKN